MRLRDGLRAGIPAAAAACLAACAGQPAQPASTAARPDRCGGQPIFAAGGDRATLWVRNSSEFRAASEAIYRAAQDALARGLADPSWSAEPSQTGDFSALPPAVVMDIDETVLDNSEPQAEMLLNGTCFDEFPKAWDDWIAKRRAPAVPGAAEFIRAARAATDGAGRPVRVFFITNRECASRAGSDAACPQQDDTLANLEALGLASPALAEELMLKGERPEWESEKLPRRQAVASSHRVILNVGDDLADFLPGVRRATVAEREQARCARAEYWGRRWFLVPNPMYGSWLVALGPDLDAALAAEPSVQAVCPGG
ncbi:MAG TPA: HAD family acid phosphatase [Steroidobacteraceae bacterium]|nr:HAD family acid phosphatase [Steroidobacteraceae bacterium]